jgi:ABC-type transport system involved in multi-copper enzyme maturation permease subunit
MEQIADASKGNVVPPCVLVARVVWLEIRRREEYKALLILMGLYLAFALSARAVGNTQEESVALMLNMGLWLSASLSALLTLLCAARLIPSEIEARTLYPLLAKPVTRGEVLLGKVLASVAAGWGCLALFTFLTAVTWAAEFPLEGQDSLMFLQAFLLQAAALLMLATFSVLLSLALPLSAAILIAGLFYFGGGSALNLLESLSGQSARVTWMTHYLPHFDKLCLLQRFTDGAPALPWGEWAGLMGYALALALFFLSVSARLFAKKVV